MTRPNSSQTSLRYLGRTSAVVTNAASGQARLWRRFARLPLKRIALWGLALNALWEVTHGLFLYDMWDGGFLRGSAVLWAAIAGDVFIVLGVTALAAFLVGAHRLFALDAAAWAALLGVGLVTGIGLEWAAQALRLWEYTDLMPTLRVLGLEVGLSPIVQVSVLPALSVRLASRGM